MCSISAHEPPLPPQEKPVNESKPKSKSSSNEPYLALKTILAASLISILLFILSPSLASFTGWSIKNPLRCCRTFPGDKDWPSDLQWSTFNKTVGGRLIKTVPIGAPCHSNFPGVSFNQDECDNIKANWHDPVFHELTANSAQAPLFANKSCDPFSPPTSQCIIGTYVQYAVNIANVDHIIKTIAFAKQHNIRFVVRNTGHDYMGKSTGAGGLAIWTGNLKQTTWMTHFNSPGYSGPAVKAQGGVSVLQMYQEAEPRGFTVVGGECPTVEWAGGYLQGGGHSHLSSLYGLAADQTLEMEGGGAYAILWTVTVKVHPNTPAAGGLVSFSTGPNVTLDLFWEGVDFYQASTPRFTDAGGVSYTSYSSGNFNLSPLFLPNGTSAQVAELLDPLLKKLTDLGIPHNVMIQSFPGLLPAYLGFFPPSLSRVGVMLFGGRLLPRRLWENPDSLNKLTSTIRKMIDDGVYAFDIAIRPTTKAAGDPHNAVLPAWRDAERMFSPTLPWNDTASLEDDFAQAHKLTTVYDTALRALAPDSGAYLNEADPFEPDFKTAFYGVNYAKLLAIKDKYDPDQVLYGATAVGGDRWAQQPDGRLCITGK
ncbi:hypothetical protein D9756_007823 [Leucocoprinus leucothites]|uniref:FAD-binding PCMH-type domain-containing protein n=1 Tax=Leucocoprinus leucothites TaxID=201217 RepID=A0A8H5D493_9AGAR|nr:hypothetical protein D9756_007823 [Leucoagaricus leucothites]